MYGPPEEKGLPRSRLYDIWSMGAITLEMIICLLYDHREVQKLHYSIQKFYVDFTEGNTTRAYVHPEVQRWIAHMYRDPRCGTDGNPTAIRRLLKLVEERLLVVKLPQEAEASDLQGPAIHPDIPVVTVEAPEDISQDAHIIANVLDAEVEAERGFPSLARADSQKL